ncbi:MAG: RHS repeat-associated core domain-containing protein, partial [Methylophilus sp.]|uniref:RHS repeat-associated core domain-containing protein n=1 Tax=Methylophilus sp. TaxID=29541 RepID=UPI004036BECB
GWHYNWHRFYDPDTGRYLTPDPIGLRGGDNAFGYAGGDPLGAVDPWGLYSVSVSGITTFHTGLSDLPTFSIATLPGWQDYSNSDLLYHQYNQRVSVSDLRGNELGRLATYLQDNPTPNSQAMPATWGGTYNPATPDRGPFAGLRANAVAPDDVMSFLRTGLSGRTYVVNVTTDNHSLKYGIVIRGVRCERGAAIFDNYGEGTGLFQAAGPVSDYFINNIWYWATETALEQVTGRRYSVNGRDWNENNPR